MRYTTQIRLEALTHFRTVPFPPRVRVVDGAGHEAARCFYADTETGIVGQFVFHAGDAHRHPGTGQPVEVYTSRPLPLRLEPL